MDFGMLGPSEEFLDLIKNAIGVENPVDVEQYIDKWKNEPVKIAITGASGVGKSFFINKMRGVKFGDVGYAPVGAGNTTTEPTKYEYSEQPNVQYWDLPGVGTPEVPLTDKYFQDIDVEKYDFFLIFFCNTIMENDVSLAKELSRREKKFAFVRTKIDEFRHQYEDRSHLVDAAIEDTKAKHMETLTTKGGINISKIYAISSVAFELGDFSNLIRDVGNSLGEYKKMNFIMSMRNHTREVIGQKKEMLLNDRWRTSLCIAIATGLPVPGIDVPVNIGLLVRKVSNYLDIFKLDERSLQGVDPHILQTLGICKIIREEGIKKYVYAGLIGLGKYGVLKLTEEAIETLIPVIGSFITGGTSFYLVHRYLKKVICDLADEALALRDRKLESCV